MIKKIIYILIFCIFLYFITYWIEHTFGVWAYLDNRRLLFYKFFGNNIRTEVLYAFNNGTHFGFDKAAVIAPRTLNTLMSVYINQYILFLIFLGANFLFTYLVISKYYSKESAVMGGILFAINPISIHFLNYMSFFFAYSSLPIFIYSFIQYLDKGKLKYLFIYSLGCIFLFSYIRVAGIYLIILLPLILLILKNKKLGTKLLKRFATIAFIGFCMLLPLLFGFIYPYFSGENDYFEGISNYASRNSEFSAKLQDKEIENGLIYNISPREVIANFSTEFNDLSLVRIYGVFFTFMMIFLFLMVIGGVNRKNHLFVVLFFGCFVILRNSALIFEGEFFTNLVFKYFPFVAGELKWSYLGFIPFLTYFVSYIYNYGGRNTRIYIHLLLFFYIVISLYPLLNIPGNYKSALISQQSIPDEYLDLFSNNEARTAESTLFYPDGYFYNDGNIKLDRTPYPIILNYNQNYNIPFNKNYRVVNGKQVDLFSSMYENKLHGNNRIFNLKNFIIIKDAVNSDNNYDWYRNGKDFESSLDFFSQELKFNELLYKDYSSKKLDLYSYVNKDSYNFSIYSPRRIYKRDISNFFSEGNIDILEKPIVVDPSSYNNIFNVNGFDIPLENQNIQIDYKSSKTQPTKKLLKLSNIDVSQSFVIHMNQTFSTNWKLKRISKAEYEEYVCKEPISVFQITQNSACNFEKPILNSLLDYRYIGRDKVSKENHFEGNFIGNSRIIKANSIPQEFSGDELYAIIVYEKQFRYILSLCISLGTLGFLLILSLAVFVKKKF